MFGYRRDELYCEGVRLTDIAKRAGTPCYVYSENAFLDTYRSYEKALAGLPHQVCYAVKANSNLAVLASLAHAGAGFDIVSGGELFRVLKAGGDASRVVFSGVGKTAAEMKYALESGIHSFNCESEAELELLNAVAGRAGKDVRFSLRVNPDVNASTHPYISTGLTEHKFGISIARAAEVYDCSRSFERLVAEGISCHIGSQILDTAPMLEAACKVIALAKELRTAGHALKHVDLGGGLGISYQASETTPSIHAFFEALHPVLTESGFAVFVEPGRSIVANAGVLLTEVLLTKRNGSKSFAVVDAAMNDLIRPALYQSHHEILPLLQSDEYSTVDVVGPVCETGDFLARGRSVAGVTAGNFLAILSVGAYGFVQSSNYNSRPRAAEVLVSGGTWRVVRERETYANLVQGESFR